MILAGTGHRPPKLGGYSDLVFMRLVALATSTLKKYKPEKIISGMALGWDQALGTAAMTLKIPVIAAVPCKNQERKWPEESQFRYHHIRAHADETHIVSEFFTSTCMQDRNKWMVDHCDMVLALWDGSSGGTDNCVRYAREVGRPVTNVWKSWIEYK